MCVCREREREKREKGKGRVAVGVQIFKFYLVCADTGREGGAWRIYLETRRKEEEEACSTVGLFFYE